jgi:hypothetical protein
MEILENNPDHGGSPMDEFAVAVLVFAALFLGAVLICGLVALAQVRRGQLERLQMKHHLRKIGLAGEG